MKLRAALYLRGQPHDDSYAAQGDAHDLVRLRRWSLVDTFVDDENVDQRRRRGLHALLDAVRARRIDAVVVSSLDRIVGSCHEFVVLVDLLRAYGCGLSSAREPLLDTRGPSGGVLCELVATFAGFERDVKVGRTRLGLELARRGGSRIGRPRSKFPLARARRMRDGGASYSAIGAALGVSKAVAHRRLVPKPSVD